MSTGLTMKNSVEYSTRPRSPAGASDRSTIFRLARDGRGSMAKHARPLMRSYAPTGAEVGSFGKGHAFLDDQGNVHGASSQIPSVAGAGRVSNLAAWRMSCNRDFVTNGTARYSVPLIRTE